MKPVPGIEEGMPGSVDSVPQRRRHTGFLHRDDVDRRHEPWMTS